MEDKKFKQVRLDTQTHRRLSELAKRTGRTRVGLIRWMLDEMPNAQGKAA